MRRSAAAVILVVSLFSFLMVSQTLAGPFEDATDAYKSDDYKTVIELAEKGNVDARIYLGRMYFEGEGVQQDYAEAMKWYRKAAEQGHADAMILLGFMFEVGQGGPKNYGEAIKWFRAAADQGSADAQYALGDMYEGGKGVPQDYPAAMEWFRKAADQGEAHAQYALGDMYEEGKGVPKNYVRAHMWYNLAASTYASSPYYESERESAEKLRDLLARKMTPAQIAEAQRLAREWKPKKEK